MEFYIRAKPPKDTTFEYVAKQLQDDYLATDCKNRERVLCAEEKASLIYNLQVSAKFENLTQLQKGEVVRIILTKEYPFVQSVLIPEKPSKSIEEVGKQIKSAVNRIIPTQPVPVTIENFFVRTYREFKEIKEVPKGFTEFFKSKKSVYYTNEAKTQLVRVSDHWGHRIRYCAWHLEGYEKISSWAWHKVHGKELKIGKIPFRELRVNNFYTRKAIESRHPI